MSKESLPKNSSKEEVLMWIEKYQQSQDEEAQTKLVLHYQQLVESIARKYSHGKSYYDDIVQVGIARFAGSDSTFRSIIRQKL